MGTPHKHRDVIIAWANGEEVEYWNDGLGEWREDARPLWGQYIKYRIKPKRIKKEGWVNVYKWSHCEGLTGHAYKSKEDADKHVMGDRVTCIRIEWEEEA